MANNKFRLTQLIAQADGYGRSAATDNRFRQETASESHDEVIAPQLVADDGEADNSPCTSHKEYQTELPGVRRRSLALAIAMTGLALLGTAGAFGYREMFQGSGTATPPPIIRASSEPNKFAPVSGEPQAKNSGNARQDAADTTGSIEKLVSREEQPVRIEQPKPPRRVAGATAPAVASGVQRAGQSAPADSATAANREHLAAGLIASAGAKSAAAVTPPVLGSGYAVQVASERGESEAQAAFRGLQGKYPSQLGGRHAIIRRADLGAAGIYYRALVGPLTSATEATRLCSNLKSAGADCIIQKN
jgi:hypothetical protein